ncbi:MAG: 23S rRNA (pseudouridine(1915)-N(3))-methyltransferase RlmH [Lachnospiraceae bacterium]|nr:23S rRNA (pseudouridine(1915)-N(3))-methyltransferase RlmH [Lachnospiraceae bacterium]
MKYEIYCNTKSISKNSKLAADEFIKRLSAYCKVTVKNKKDKLPNINLDKEGCLLLAINNGPSTLSSEELSTYISDIQLNGISTVYVAVGYDPEDIKKLTTDKIKPLSIINTNLSNETTLILTLEQIYRAYTIIQGKTYHK